MWLRFRTAPSLLPPRPSSARGARSALARVLHAFVRWGPFSPVARSTLHALTPSEAALGRRFALARSASHSSGMCRSASAKSPTSSRRPWLPPTGRMLGCACACATTPKPVARRRARTCSPSAARERWMIEEYSKAPKAGCAHEKRQLGICTHSATRSLYSFRLPGDSCYSTPKHDSDPTLGDGPIRRRRT